MTPEEFANKLKFEVTYKAQQLKELEERQKHDIRNFVLMYARDELGYMIGDIFRSNEDPSIVLEIWDIDYTKPMLEWDGVEYDDWGVLFQMVLLDENFLPIKGLGKSYSTRDPLDVEEQSFGEHTFKKIKNGSGVREIYFHKF